jgi:hypothetical protein
MRPSNRSGAFYRVRVWQGSAAHQDVLEIAVFKIISSDDQHGILLNDPSQPPTADPPPYWPQEAPMIDGFDPERTQDLRLIVDISEDAEGIPIIRAKLVDPADPTRLLLEEPGARDVTADPHRYAGLVGLAHFDGESFFDDFWMTEK